MWEIKAGGVSNLSDARYFAAKAVHWMGFPLDGGAPGEGIMMFKAIREWVAVSKVVGEFSATDDVNEIAALAIDLKLDAVQLSPRYTVAEAAALAQQGQGAGFSVWQEIEVSNYAEDAQLTRVLEAYSPHVIGFVLKSDDDWSMLSLTMLSSRFGIVVQPNDAGQVPDLLTVPGLRGIELRGSNEEKPGYKSFDDVEAVFDFLPDEFA